MKKISLSQFALFIVVGLIVSCSKSDTLSTSLNNTVVDNKAPSKLPVVVVIDLCSN